MRQAIKGRTVGTDIARTEEILQQLGIETKYRNNSALESAYNAAYGAFGGGFLDSLTKSVVANTMMKGYLKDKGMDLKGVTDKQAAELFVETVSKLPVEEQAKVTGDIAKELGDISDFSALSRGQISGLSSRLFNTLKNFGRTTLSRFASYPAQIANDLALFLSKKISAKEFASSTAQKAGFLVADLYLLDQMARSVVDKLYGPGDSEEDKKAKKKLSDKLAGGDIGSRIGNLLTNPFVFPAVSMLSDTFQNAVKL